MTEGIVIVVVAWALTWAALYLPPLPLKWAEGWLFPHSEPKSRCLLKCSTCKVGESM